MLLHPINPKKNEARYYRVEVGPCINSFYAICLNLISGIAK